jgi:YjbE family integral membrane protein
MIEFLTTLHYAVLAKIVMIDLVLGIDNAIIIAMACAALAPEQRNKAIMLGTAGAIGARILFLFIGFWLVGLPFVKLLAGGYLLYLTYSILSSSDDAHDIKAKPSLWGAAFTIVVADIAMSLDNVIALVGASESTGAHAFGYTVFGILISIPIIIFASKGLLKVIDKFPIVIWAGAALIGWVGVEMMFKESFIKDYLYGFESSFVLGIHVLLVGIVLLIVYLKNKCNKT